MQRLGQDIAEAEAEKVGCLAEVHQRRVIGTRMEQMVKLGGRVAKQQERCMTSIWSTGTTRVWNPRRIFSPNRPARNCPRKASSFPRIPNQNALRSWLPNGPLLPDVAVVAPF